MPPEGGRQVRLDSLGPRELQMIQENLQEELQGLAQSSLALQKAAGELGTSGQAVQQLADREPGQTSMIPLTSSLYVEAELDSSASVLVEIGTGYYAEKSVPDGADYFKRKVTMVKGQLDKIGQALQEKQRMHEQVVRLLRLRAQESQK